MFGFFHDPIQCTRCQSNIIYAERQSDLVYISHFRSQCIARFPMNETPQNITNATSLRALSALIVTTDGIARAFRSRPLQSIDQQFHCAVSIDGTVSRDRYSIPLPFSASEET